MVRISGVDIPNDKRIEIALTHIYGIGPKRAGDVLEATNISPDTRPRDLTDDDVIRLREFIDGSFLVEGDLRRDVRQNVARLIEINCYRGQRHRRNLPAHGQRTRTNARQKRGARKTVAGRRRVGK